MRRNSANAGKRSAVRNNSGEPVHPSGPGLGVGPTPPPTAGRKPEACPPKSLGVSIRPAPSQHKTGRVPEGGALGGREAPALSLDAFSVSQLRQLFGLLDQWDREAAHAKTM
jgi:hypothetical protein